MSPVAAAETAPGLLAQLPGSGGCVVDEAAPDVANCDNGGRALTMYGWGGATVSPDGHSVYVAAANNDAVAVFDRNGTTGALAQKAGTAGCIVAEPSPDVVGCNNSGRATGFPSSIAISPDGRHAYVAAYNSGAIAVFDRDASTGALVQKAGAAGCIVDATAIDVPPCNHTGRALLAARAVAVSPDGTSVYAVSDGDDSIAIFDRDTATGEITQKAGTTGCIVNAPLVDIPTCDNSGRAMGLARDVVVSPDSRSVYVAALGQDSIAVFDRDPLTGALTQKAGAAGCIVNGPSTDVATCDNTGRALDGALQTAVSPAGDSVYVASAISSAVATFNRDSQTGALTQKAGAAGCTVDEPSPDIATCDNTGRALGSAAVIAASPDGRSIYVGGESSNSVATFDRDVATGTVTQRAGSGGCIVDSGSSPVATCDNTARALAGPQAVTVSPDGKSVYMSAVGSNSVLGFRRDLIPVCAPVASTALHNQATPIALSCSDPNGDPVTLSLAGQPAHGTATVTQAAAQAVYTPTAGFAGGDTFAYLASANAAVSAPAAVTLDVLPGQEPVCAPQARSIGQGVTTTLALSCAAGGDPITLAIGGAPAHGSLGAIAQSTGLVDYTPAAGYSGADAFDYHATSSFGQSAAAPFGLAVLPSSAGPQGPIGPQGPPAFKLEVALFEARLRAVAGSRVRVRYISTVNARVELSVLRKSKVIARTRQTARAGANAIVWNGRAGRKVVPPGVYRLRLKAVNGDQSVTRTSSLELIRRKR